MTYYLQLLIVESNGYLFEKMPDKAFLYITFSFYYNFFIGYYAIHSDNFCYFV